MKILFKGCINKRFNIKLIPEDIDDMWNLYSFIKKGDIVESVTYRRPTSNRDGDKKRLDKVKVVLQIEVEKTFLDMENMILGLKGQILSELKNVKVGSFHTINIESGQVVLVSKNEELDLLENHLLSDFHDSHNQHVYIVGIQSGLSNIYLVTHNIVHKKITISSTIPLKSGKKERGKMVNEFYKKVYGWIQNHIDLDALQMMLIAGPGFHGSQFLAFLHRQNDPNIVKNKKKLHRMSSDNCYMDGIKTHIKDNNSGNVLLNLKSMRHQTALSEFFSVLSVDPERTYYGLDHVYKLSSKGCIKTLIVSLSSLSSTYDKDKSVLLKETMSNVRSANGEVVILGNNKDFGERIECLGGFAAVLKYPVAEDSL